MLLIARQKLAISGWIIPIIFVRLFFIFLEVEKLKIERAQFINELAAENIGSSVHYKPVHMMSYYANKYGWKPESFPNAARGYERMISIPLSAKMTIEDAQDVVNA